MATTKSIGLTIEGVLQALFPRGYLDHERYLKGLKQKSAPAWPTTFEHPPCRAVDLFAIAGFLLLRSGAYHHVSPEVSMTHMPRTISVTQEERDRWREAGAEWRGDGKGDLPAPPRLLLEAWAEVLAHRHRNVYRAHSALKQPRKWWRAALALLCIADEAAKDLGFETGLGKSAQARFAEIGMRRGGTRVFTVSVADPDQVCVLPKSRTPKVGCTLRSLSHNLALLPPRGMARSFWTMGPPRDEPASTSAPFNLLVVPAPFQIRAAAFRGVPADEGTWGWFEVEPHWCPPSQEADQPSPGFDTFYTFVNDLILKAEEDVGVVHGLVFPEAALSDEIFRRLCRRLLERPNFELLIAGLFDAKMDGDPLRRGNFAAMAAFQPGAEEAEAGFNISIREKHHRWRIDGSQIETYALGSALDVNRGWWERIDIMSRSLDMFVLRGVATVTTLICEDLARNDPCQELVRGIGPNLVVALLMDGPQLKNRWPARYATVLAEDPGSSVLTVTSLGLIARTNSAGHFPPARQVGLWQDDSGKAIELSLPNGAQALCLSLQPSTLHERTLDGRSDAGASQSWRLTGIAPITIEADAQIMAGDWPSGAV